MGFGFSGISASRIFRALRVVGFCFKDLGGGGGRVFGFRIRGHGALKFWSLGSSGFRG